VTGISKRTITAAIEWLAEEIAAEVHDASTTGSINHAALNLEKQWLRKSDDLLLSSQPYQLKWAPDDTAAVRWAEWPK
jgi:hypothetical protein